VQDSGDNFVKFNIAWFTAMNDEGTFKVSEINAEKDECPIGGESYFLAPAVDR
jgi:hypothetical protein